MSEASATAHPMLRSTSAGFAAGLARFRQVIDTDAALPAWVKALYVAAAAAARGADGLLARELRRAEEHGLTVERAQGAAMALLLSRGEPAFDRFVAAITTVFGGHPASDDGALGQCEATVAEAYDYFRGYFGSVPDYVELLGTTAPRALEGYFAMRNAALSDNSLEAKYVELLTLALNAADYQPRFVAIHLAGARRQGASEEEVVEALLCAVPVAGIPSWITAGPIVMETRSAP